MKFDIIPDKEALGQCAWCRCPLDDHMDVAALGAQVKPDVDLSGYQGHCIEIELASGGKTACAMVTVKGSEASRAGNDCMFLVCSRECEAALTGVLENEIASGELFAAVPGSRE